MTIKTRYREELQKKYWLNEKGYKRVIEELKQRVTAKTTKVRWYKKRIKQFRQYKLFQTDQNRLYQELNGEDRSGVSPDKEQGKSFWSNIWSKEINDNSSVERIGEIKEEVGVQEQENIELTADKMEKMLKMLANWKALGPDLVQAFWLKNFRSMHGRMLIQLNKCLNKGNVPNWMTKGLDYERQRWRGCG